jgi:hypothetical protein
MLIYMDRVKAKKYLKENLRFEEFREEQDYEAK